MRKMIRHVRSKRGQRTPLKGQVRNSAGGFSYRCSKWQALDRFLVLGTTSGSYYASGRSLTLERVKTVAVCLEANGAKTVDAVVAVSKSGRAPCNDQAILCLAMALKTGDEATRRRASKAVVHVCRTGTHLYQLAEAVSVFGGWGVLTRKAFASWFDARDGAGLAYQAIKYRNRNGWTARDVLRKAHVAPASAEAASVIDWMAHGWSGDLPSTAPEGARAQIWAFERAKSVDTAAEMARLIFDFRLPREAVPTHWLKSPLVWDALLQSGMPLGALVRNLGKLSSVGLLVDRSEASALVCERLTDKVALVRARMHPLKLLLARNTYARNRGVRSKLTWRSVQRVSDALERAFYLSFKAIKPTNKRWKLAVDVSGSMGCPEISGMVGITPRVGAAAMAMVTARTEPQHTITAFSHRLQRVELGAGATLERVLATFDRIPMGATDCALPITTAMAQRERVDVFVVYTDSETWFGKTHPAAALRAYRDRMGIAAKLIVVGMVANKFTIADPDDNGMLDVVGFDTAAPALMADFAA